MTVAELIERLQAADPYGLCEVHLAVDGTLVCDFGVRTPDAGATWVTLDQDYDEPPAKRQER